MIFRAFLGEPVDEARSLQEGHLAHHEGPPRNPATGEEEDTDVGFPGPGHFIAEREWPMKAAMGTLALLAVVAGALQIPGVDDEVTKFLRPTFADSKFLHAEVPDSPAWVGLIIGAAIALAGIGIAYRLWVAAPGTPVAAARAAGRRALVPGAQVVLR